MVRLHLQMSEEWRFVHVCAFARVHCAHTFYLVLHRLVRGSNILHGGLRDRLLVVLGVHVLHGLLHILPRRHGVLCLLGHVRDVALLRSS